MLRTDNTGPDGVLKEMLDYTSLSNKYVSWGGVHEPAARVQYLLTMKKQFPDIKVSQTGLFVCPDTPYLGASPDGLVSYNCRGESIQDALEIKCPATNK